MFPTTSLTPYEIFNNAMNMRKICKNRFASTILLLFTHVSTMTTFFEERGFPINFILGIVGVTNSRKTSLAMEFTKIFSEKKKMADAEFTATDAGIEKTLSKYKDAPILTNRECSRKLPIQCGNHLRYLYIKKELLQKKISEI